MLGLIKGSSNPKDEGTRQTSIFIETFEQL